MEVVNGDALVVKMPNNTQKKIFLASIRPPREKYVSHFAQTLHNFHIFFMLIHFSCTGTAPMRKAKTRQDQRDLNPYMIFHGCMKRASFCGKK